MRTIRIFSILSIFSLYCAHNFTQDIKRSTTSEKSFDFLDHKNRQLNLYLDLIRYNTEEKIGILPYILKKPDGTYLEIGTGGDPIAKMLSQIPSTSPVTLIASDIETGVLQALPHRHPELQQYLDASQGLKLKLMQMDATDMSVFKDNFLSGINASSIVHEIISYGGGFHGMKKFFKEAFRTLKLGGILAYRDPESVLDKKELVSLSLHTKNIRLFTHIFLYKFLDQRGSSLAKSGRKFKMYDPKSIMFTIYKKNVGVPSILTYEEYLKIPSYDIDFSRKYYVTLPSGLYRELARHYLTYLHQCNPLVFVKCTPDIVSGQYTVNYLAHSTSGLFSLFLKKNGDSLEGAKIDLAQKIKLNQHIEDIGQVLEFGIHLHFSDHKAQYTLRNILQEHGFSPSNYIIALSDKDCLLDYRIFGLLYDEIHRIIFDEFSGIAEKKDEEHTKWLKREGEEFYFYLSADELITAVLKMTQTEYINEHGIKQILVLCPLTADHNKFIERICYSEILKDSLRIEDTLGYEIDVIDGKRFIHFSKMTLQDAIPICRDIIKTDSTKYKKLKTYLDSLKV